MPTYAIGDIQGCYDELRRLLDRLDFDPATDRLWLAGDLVNRGPDSLRTLRFVRGLGEAASTVLGNHDLHLLACAAGAEPRKPKDSFGEVLEAPDADELIGWLRRLPLLHHDPALGYTMIHAGLAPQWTLDQARRLAAEAEAEIRNEASDFFHHMYGDQPDLWGEALCGHERTRFTVNCLTRLRYCRRDGHLALQPKGAPDDTGDELLPWFAVPGRASAGQRLVFGHWSTLGRIHWPEYAVHGLDSGCVWGGSLSALTLETGALTQEPCTAYQRPGD